MGFWRWLWRSRNGGEKAARVLSACDRGIHDLPCPTNLDRPGGQDSARCGRCGRVFVTVDSMGQMASQPYIVLLPGMEQRWWVDKEKYYEKCRRDGERERAVFADPKNWYKQV